MSPVTAAATPPTMRPIPAFLVFNAPFASPNTELPGAAAQWLVDVSQESKVSPRPVVT